MNAHDLYQVVVPPDEANDALMAALTNATAKIPTPDISTGRKVQLVLARMLHPLGLHTWVRWMQYDTGSGRVIDTGGKTCQWCPRARYDR